MSTKKYLLNTINSTEKHEFDKIVKSYLKEIFGFNRIVNTDGKNDSGIDIKVFDINGIYNQYQVTTQRFENQIEKRNFEKKLFEDIGKAKENHLNFGYTNILYFFSSQKITNKYINLYRAKSLKDYGISLTIIDANQIAEESEEYKELLNQIISTNDLKDYLNKNEIFPNNDKILIFDLLSFGKASDLRLQIIEAYILKQIYYKKEMSKGEIVECFSQFQNVDNSLFNDHLINRLKSEKKIKNNNEVYFLTENEHKRISNLIGQNEIEEASFIKLLVEILKEYNQEDNIDEYLKELKNVYTSNFNSDLSEILLEHGKDLSIVSRDFLQFLISKGIDEKETKNLAVKMFNVCKENYFLQKYCAAKVFSETTKINNINIYINTKKRIFIDTQIVLHSLCYFYNNKSTYKNYFYNITSTLLNLVKKNNLKLFLPSNYLWEAQNHVREALNLIPFTNLPNFERLGKSRNVFYNFYLFERENYNKQLTYQKFLNEFGFKENDRYTKHNSLIESYVNKLNIYVVNIEENYYDIDESKKIIQSILLNNDKFKSNFGLNNDAIILEYLADNNIETHPLQPMLLSWDKVLFKAQNEFFKKNPTAQRWFILTPSRFIDQYSLLQFSIDSETVTNEILALLSNDLIHGTHSLLDSITHILNPNEEVGLKYTNRLSEIRDNEIHRLKENQIILPEDIEGEAVIDDIMYSLTLYYRETKNNLDGFKKIFSNINLIDDVTRIINNSIEYIYKTKKFDDNIYSKFDELINVEQ